MEINKRILIVDDNEAIHRDFRKILAPRLLSKTNVDNIESALFGDDEDFKETSNPADGYELEFAFQADAALTMVKKAEEESSPYAIVFTDVRMPPGKDGIHLVGLLLKASPYVEIVIVTAYSDYSWDQLSEKFGWTDRILIQRKPFDGITIKQICSTLTKKWALGCEERKKAARMSSNLATLERRVEERTARLAQAFKELQNFAYIVSHDLRSPLVSIRGFVSELRFDLEKVLQAVDLLLPNLDEIQQSVLAITLRENIPEAMDFIDTSTSKMDHLIKGILKLARLGHRKFSYELVDFSEVVAQQLKVLAYPIEKDTVKVEVDDLPKAITDRLALEQIIGHLLSNAIKYLKPNQPGEIQISGRCAEDGRVTIAISDNGRGIHKDDMPLIFEIFQRGSERDVPGEGMGLTYVKTLLQRLGGLIWCDSSPDDGATFCFSLPKDPPQLESNELVDIEEE